MSCGFVPAWIPAAVFFLLLLILETSAASAQLLKPDANWMTFDTEHFHVSFTPEVEGVARRAAESAERAHGLLSSDLMSAPAGQIHLVVADNADYANGVATPFPRKRIVVYAHAPSSDPYLAFYDDWIELVVLHELVHIFHLSSGGGVWPALRGIFGRNPSVFPQVFTPGWLIEGLATYAESRFTESGRVRGSMYEMILRTSVLEDGLRGIDHVTLEPSTWPGGISRYLLGAFFVDYLSKRFGPSGVEETVDAIGRQLIPYRLDSAASGVLGTSLTRAWEDWSDSLRIVYAARLDSMAATGLTEPEILTVDGRIAEHPRYAPDGRLVFTANTGRSEPGLMLLRAGQSPDRMIEISGSGAGSWTPDGRLIFSQLEFAGPHSLLADLFVMNPGGRVRRITRGARVWDPHSHPIENRAVAVADARGTNVLVSVDLGTGEVRRLTQRDLDTQWAGPRWSPDGDRIAASRWRPDGRFDIVMLDSAGGQVRQITDEGAVDSSPAWSPDGRYVLFSSDRTGVPNLYAFDTILEVMYRVTNVSTGAFQPDVSPDGRWIAFSYYQNDGYHIARIPFEPERWTAAGNPVANGRAAPVDRATEFGEEARIYSAWPSVLPTWWSPRLSFGSDEWTRLGLVTGGRDVVERHAWGLSLGGYPENGRAEMDAEYRYSGMGNPELIVRLGQDWAIQSAELEGSGGDARPELARRTRDIEAALSTTHQRLRRSVVLQGGLEMSEVDFLWGDPVDGDEQTRTDLHLPLDAGAFLSLGYSTVRRYDLSLSAQHGLRSSVRAQANRYLSRLEGDASSRDYWRVTTRNAAFVGWDLFGFAPSVLALRLDAGVETSDALSGFSVGGSSGAVGIATVDIGIAGRTAAYPIRGYPAGVQRGNRVASGSAEFRFPLLLVERGYRLFPVGIERIWADVFADVGTAWCAGGCGASSGLRPRPLASAGAEVVLDLKVGYGTTLPLRGGVALPLDRAWRRRPQVYARFGVSF